MRWALFSGPLLSGEQHEATAAYDPPDANGKDAVLEIGGYDVALESANPRKRAYSGSKHQPLGSANRPARLSAR
jgi:hypothetical protein